MPDSQKIAYELELAIKNNVPPQKIFYQFLSSGSMEANIVWSQIEQNKQIIRLVTSPKGRAWIKANIDAFLNYLQMLGQ